ncbi:MAG: N-acetylmuramoyl-L-alanine amidase [Acidobacteriaceae bacterium]
MPLTYPQRGQRRMYVVVQSVLVAALLCPVSPSVASTRHHSSRASARASGYDYAMRLYNDLERKPESERTRADYTRVMNAFREVYHANPAAAKADDSIYAVAGLLAEQGRVLHSEKSSRDAVAQYEFLRKQYPTSSYRISALMAEAQIEQSDLHDPAAAKAKYDELLKHYPRSAQANEAMANLQQAAPAAEKPATEKQDRHTASRAERSAAATTQQAELASNPSSEASISPSATPIAEPRNVASSGLPTHLTRIRYWSTSNYTRVVLDLGAPVQYEVGHIPNPDRFYFDLKNTRLAHRLFGKTIEVKDEGFLRHIRPAQFKPNVTRVVFDVNPNTDYSVFVMANPDRLIIDIHAKGMVPVPVAPPSSPPPPTGSISQAVPAPASSQPAQAVLAKSNIASRAQDTPANGGVLESAEYSRPAEDTVATSRAPVNAASSASTPSRLNIPATLPENPPARTASAGKPSANLAELDKPAWLTTNAATQPSGMQAAAPPATAIDNSVLGAKNSGRGRRSKNADAAAPMRVADPTATGQRSLVRTLGLKIGRIVIDPGHGGHDSGTIGPGGLEEKDVVLDVALRLGKLLQQRMGEDVVYTRSDDTFIPLEERTAIANKDHADLFISIHANSSPERDVRGVETYYLNFTSQPDSLQVAARENAASDESIHQLSDLVKKIALSDKLEESREFASDVQDSLYSGLKKGNSGFKDRGVKQAPFVVLIGANMPSILAEISFLTNPKDAREMRQPAYRQRIAESLYRGVAEYINGLSGIRVAQNTPQRKGK